MDGRTNELSTLLRNLRVARLGPTLVALASLAQPWPCNAQHQQQKHDRHDDRTPALNRRCIFSWYLTDEPDGSNIPAPDVAAAAKAIRTLDPRPVSLVLCEATNQTKALPYAMSADILMADPYPIGRAGDNVSAVVEATDAVVDLIARAEGEDGRHRLAIMVPQARLACPAEKHASLPVLCRAHS